MTTEVAADAVPRPAIATARFEIHLNRIVGVFGVLYAAQTAYAFVVDLPSTPDLPGIAPAVLLLAAVGCGLGASLRPRRPRPFLLGAVVLYAVAVAVWLLAVRAPVPVTPYPWLPAAAVSVLAYLAVLCRRVRTSLIAGGVLSASLGAALGTVCGLPPASAIGDALFLAAMSVGLTLLVTAVRRGVRRADDAHATALDDFARTRADDAVEEERRRTDALLHDAVLTTYLTAATAQTPEEREMAARMAANARRILAHVTQAAAHGPVVPFDQAYRALRQELETLLPAFDVHAASGDVMLPVEVADAMLQAMLEVMTNSVQHAHATARELRLAPLGPDGLRITVRDDGVGFDPSRLRTARMQETVVQRLHRVDGRADVQSQPGHGCSVVLSWGSVVIAGVAPLPDADRALGVPA